jgi:hypothetical protein
VYRKGHSSTGQSQTSMANMTRHGRSMMNTAYVPNELRFKICSDEFQGATYLDGLSAIVLDGKLTMMYEHWVGSNPKFAKHLRIWGDAGTIMINTVAPP